MISLRSALRGLTFSCLLTPAVSADVLVVSAGGGGDFATLQAAVNAAADGDTLLVRAGSYAGFGLLGKGLAIVGEPGGAAPQVGGAIRVDNLPKGSTVVLSGLEVTVSYTTDLTHGHALVVNQCAGSVRVQDCVLTGANNANDGQPNFGDGSGGSGAFVVSSQDVVFVRGTLVGGRGHQQYDCCDFGGTGGEGLHAISSIVSMYGCDVTGGLGGYSGWGGDGGAAVFAPDFGVFVTGCALTGGKGGFGDDFIFGPGGSGGAGLKLGATAQAQLRDNVLTGGEGGESILGQNGAPGQPIQAEPGATVNTYLGAARRFTMQTVGWEGSSVKLTVEGQPGDQVWLPGSAKTGFRFLPQLGSVWAIGLPVKMLAAPQGVVPAGGVLELLIPITALAGEEDLRHFQGYVVATNGQVLLGTPNSFTRLGCAFSPDCDASGVPDACEIQSGALTDCNHNGIPDVCDTAAGTLPDCNQNGVADVCDIASGTSVDCDQDGVPDECQYDCNQNGIADVCDVQSGFSSDCDGNLVPDECDADCNANGVPDACDISLGTSLDLNRNGVPDECQSASDVYLVDDDGPPYGADGTPAKPFDTLGKAFAYAIDGNAILVADGTYTGPENRGLSFAGRDLAIVSQNGAASVVIDCGGIDRAFVFDAGTSLAARLEGLTIRNGDAQNALPQPNRGGGILVQSGGAATVVDCIVEDCDGRSFGGGVAAAADADLELRGCSLRDNRADVGAGNQAGGGGLWVGGNPQTGNVLLSECEVLRNTGFQGSGLYFATGFVRIESCDVSENLPPTTANGVGGGIHHMGVGPLEIVDTLITANRGRHGGGVLYRGATEVTLSNCVLMGNSTFVTGAGGVAFDGAGNSVVARVENCLFDANTGTTFGPGSGGLNGDELAELHVTGCTFVGNSGNYAGAVHVDLVGLAVFRNNVLWDNEGSFEGDAFQVGQATLDVDHCDVDGGLASVTTYSGAAVLWGTHILDLDPLFVDRDGADGDPATWMDNDLRLGPLSPCADAGDNAAVGADVFDLDGDLDTLEPVPFDLDLLPRFEDDPAVPDTGAGTAPIVDIGAYERP